MFTPPAPAQLDVGGTVLIAPVPVPVVRLDSMELLVVSTQFGAGVGACSA